MDATCLHLLLPKTWRSPLVQHWVTDTQQQRVQEQLCWFLGCGCSEVEMLGAWLSWLWGLRWRHRSCCSSCVVSPLTSHVVRSHLSRPPLWLDGLAVFEGFTWARYWVWGQLNLWFCAVAGSCFANVQIERMAEAVQCHASDSEIFLGVKELYDSLILLIGVR